MQYRKATMADIPAMHTLIQNYAKEGIMLRRPIMMLYESVRDFVVAVDEATGQVVGCGGLHILWSDLAEIRSLAVHPDFKGRGVGKGIVDYLVGEGEALGLGRIFALTYQQVFFEKCGFHVVQKESLPQKVWKECVYCDKFHNCDEIAVIRFLVPQEQLPDETFEIPLFEMPNWQKG
jgi:amino-acid N-acetyltransferase